MGYIAQILEIAIERLLLNNLLKVSALNNPLTTRKMNKSTQLLKDGCLYLPSIC